MAITQKLQQQQAKAIYFMCYTVRWPIWSLNINHNPEMMHFLPCENLGSW